MTQLAVYLIPAAAIAAYITSVALKAPGRVGLKVLCIAGLAGLLPLALAGFADLLGRPKPVALQHGLTSRPDATVVAATMEEGRNIWLWVAFDGSREPRAFALPWDLELAKELRKAQAEGERDGAKVKMRLSKLRKEGEDKIEPVFYAAPPPPLPEKTADAG